MGLVTIFFTIFPIPVFCTSCPKGLSCSDGETFETCPINSYCEKGREPSICSAGEYNDNNQGTSRNACYKCPAGYFCDGTNPPTLCQAGTSCLRAEAEETCSTLTYCPAGAIVPLECLPGQDCSDPAVLAPCASGSYCNPTTTTVINDCPAGFYCNVDQVRVKIENNFIFNNFFFFSFLIFMVFVIFSQFLSLKFSSFHNFLRL